MCRSGDASIKTFNIEDKVFVANLEGHEDSVQAAMLSSEWACVMLGGQACHVSVRVAYEFSLQDVVFEPQANKFLISASSDATFSLWQ